jgi:hypothetical protein
VYFAKTITSSTQQLEAANNVQTDTLQTVQSVLAADRLAASVKIRPAHFVMKDTTFLITSATPTVRMLIMKIPSAEPVTSVLQTASTVQIILIVSSVGLIHSGVGQPVRAVQLRVLHVHLQTIANNASLVSISSMEHANQSVQTAIFLIMQQANVLLVAQDAMLVSTLVLAQIVILIISWLMDSASNVQVTVQHALITLVAKHVLLHPSFTMEPVSKTALMASMATRSTIYAQHVTLYAPHARA